MCVDGSEYVCGQEPRHKQGARVGDACVCCVRVGDACVRVCVGVCFMDENMCV